MRLNPLSSAQLRPFRALLALSLLTLSGCSKPDPSKLDKWTPADHKNSDKPAPGQVDVKKRAGMPNLDKHGITDVVLATWKQNCVTCHGVIGRGDGPQGRALKPTDLTNPTWQKNAIDSEVAFTIKNGRGRMPAFKHLPDETVTGLIRLIRLLNSNRAAQPASGAAADSKTATPAEATSPEQAPAKAKNQPQAPDQPAKAEKNSPK